MVEARYLDAIRQLPGVKAVHPLISKSLDNWHSVPLIGAPQVWEAVGLTGAGRHDRHHRFRQCPPAPSG